MLCLGIPGFCSHWIHGWEYWLFQDRSFLILQAIPLVRSELPCACGLCCRKISGIPMRLQVFLIFGEDGILHYQPGSGITYTYRWEETGREKGVLTLT